jgi:hypothetical protein
MDLHIPAEGTSAFYWGQLSTQKNEMELGLFPFAHTCFLSCKGIFTEHFLIFKQCTVNSSEGLHTRKKIM